MIVLEPLQSGDFDTVARWNEGKSQDFLVQWSGTRYEYPLTAAFLREHHAGHNEPGASEHIYRIMLSDEMIGTVMLFRFDPADNSAAAGRFLIREDRQGSGHGQQALGEIVRIAFEEFGLAKVKLGVFDFNENAIRCYEKVGFRTCGFQPDAWQSAAGPWGLRRMEITSDQWKAQKGC